jgi:hypothetical protein
VEAFGFGSTGSQVYRFAGWNVAGQPVYDCNLRQRFGGQVMGQYYFTNQWYTTIAWGFTRTFGDGAFETDPFAPNGKANAFVGSNNAVDYHQEVGIALWYRPIQAFKFGLQYAYARTNYYQNLISTANSDPTNLGEAHRVEFVGLFFF